MTFPTLAQAGQDAAAIRQLYERWSFALVPAIVVVAFLAAIIGVLWPGGYGQDIVERVMKLQDTFLSLTGVLLAGTGITLTRGHFDARRNAAQNGDTNGNPN